MINQKIASLLGLAQKAGKVISGDNTCRAKFRFTCLIILSEDCSDNTREYFKHQCTKEQKPILIIGERIELGMTIGKSPRTVVGITDSNFVYQIISLLEGEVTG